MYSKWSKVNYQNGNKVFYFQNNKGRNSFFKIKKKNQAISKQGRRITKKSVDSLFTEKGGWKIVNNYNKY